uniref:Pentatricopeptide repeat-containing protein n=1 Tax=Rhizophora mucronata TaxID=61149 RepID=A0A2P2NFG1_RHIMU
MTFQVISLGHSISSNILLDSPIGRHFPYTSTSELPKTTFPQNPCFKTRPWICLHIQIAKASPHEPRTHANATSLAGMPSRIISRNKRIASSALPHCEQALSIAFQEPPSL